MPTRKRPTARRCRPVSRSRCPRWRWPTSRSRACCSCCADFSQKTTEQSGGGKPPPFFLLGERAGETPGEIAGAPRGNKRLNNKLGRDLTLLKEKSVGTWREKLWR